MNRSGSKVAMIDYMSSFPRNPLVYKMLHKKARWCQGCKMSQTYQCKKWLHEVKSVHKHTVLQIFVDALAPLEPIRSGKSVEKKVNQESFNRVSKKAVEIQQSVINQNSLECQQSQ